MELQNFRKERNIRDLGGYPTTNGKVVKEGLFYRCAALNLFSEDELNELKKLNIKTILDFRSKQESDANPDPIIDGVIYLQHSGLQLETGKGVDFSPQGMLKIGASGAEQFAKLKRYYASIPYQNEALHVFFEQILKQNLPICFHCFTGKDRTGAAAMLLLALLQVDKQTIMDDYLLSNINFADTIQQKLAASPIDLNEHPETKELLELCFGVSPKIGEAIYEGVLEKFGSFEEYFKQEYQFTDEDIRFIRSFATIEK